MALDCLGSFQTYCKDPHRLWIFDDGSLTEPDKDQLKNHLGDFRFVSREEADDAAADQLANHPNITRYRSHAAVALKVTDIPLFFPDGFAFTDSDVLLTRPIHGFAIPRHHQWDARFMQDEGEAYCFPPYRRGITSPANVRLVPRLNAGFFQLNAGFFDRDYADWVIGKVLDDQYPSWFLDQTTLAALASRNNAARFNPEQVRVPPEITDDTTDIPAVVHFIGSYRDPFKSPLYRRKLASHSRPAEEAPTELQTAPFTRDSLLHAVSFALLRRFRLRFGHPGSPKRYHQYEPVPTG